ncbi:hypothetical protein SLEP1_g42814 [Rubroshorea leprosula]|uniref:F-box domain-containing protein n=1 Tax=Rubroshorea leprosula TaxID=152421 RepID=A0AAV5LBG7_9ROSI|nr:hypothetical protein SLEP1_g42814 [Rubroshorea leprosula]
MESFSRLPDELLLHILSFLSFKEAVRTSVLSKRWRYLYASLSKLDLHFRQFAFKEAGQIDLMNVVDRIFFYRDRCPIDKFKFRWLKSEALDPLRLEGWIKAVMWHGVRNLQIRFDPIELKELLLPTSLFTSKTLVDLKLSYTGALNMESGGSGLELPAHVFLPSLKFLHLRNVTFSNVDSWNRLFSNCPVLEDLYFFFNNGRCKFTITHPKLKMLTLQCAPTSRKYGRTEIVINAPNLVYLEYIINDADSLTFVNVQSLDEADIQFSELHGRQRRYTRVATDVMVAIKNIQTLWISGPTIRILKLFSVPIPVFHNLTHLTIHQCDTKVNELPYLLERCKSLETLVLQDLFFWDPNAWSSVKESRFSFTFCLKKIEILIFLGKDSQMEMVKYFLEKARVLESMEIHIPVKYEKLSKIIRRVLMLPKVSKECNVTFFQAYTMVDGSSFCQHCLEWKVPDQG